VSAGTGFWSSAAITLPDSLLILGGWVGLWIILMTRPRGEKGPERRRDRRSMFGILLQGAGFGIAWGFRRSLTPVPWSPGPAAIARTGGIALLMGLSLLLVFTAVRRLGKQWSITARVLESHRLVTDGPYGFVRHPIYTAMLGMLLATGLALSRPAGLLAGVALYVAGTRIRIGSEERLLRETFGADYEAYVRRVGAFLPRPFGVKG
jgi:protein-S-isoprenylcysteine O-methyltransferase Ste14